MISKLTSISGGFGGDRGGRGGSRGQKNSHPSAFRSVSFRRRRLLERNAAFAHAALTHIQEASVTEVDVAADAVVVVHQAEVVLVVDAAVLWAQRVEQRPLLYAKTMIHDNSDPTADNLTGAPQTRWCLHRARQGGHVGHQVHGPRCCSLRREARHH